MVRLTPAPSLQPPDPAQDQPTFIPRLVALIEVLICSDFPTQLAIAATLWSLGVGPFRSGGGLNVAYVVALSLADTVALVGLIVMFLYAHGERPRDVFLGRRRAAAEISAGLPLIPVAFGIAITVFLTIQRFAPSLHTIEHNPLQALLRSPRDAWLLALVVVVAGGVREEIQRAFVLHRFEVWLGGGGAGIVISSVIFGAGHLIQGADAAIATGLLGAFWGAVYLRRRSCIAPMVSHSAFDLLQIVQFLVVGR